MAPRKKKDEPEQETEQVKPSEVTAVISSGKLKKLMAAHRAAVRDAAQITSALASEIKDAKKNHHLHTGAFKLVTKLDKMEPEELRNFMDHFAHYYDVSGLEKRADSVIRMNLDEEGEGDDEEEGDGKKRTNVQPFPTAGTA